MNNLIITLWHFFCIWITCIDPQINHKRFVYFADDTTIFTSDSDINNVQATVNRELVGVDNWLKTNRLSLNVSKTSYVIILIQKNALYIKIRDLNLTKVSAVKFLRSQSMKILLLTPCKLCLNDSTKLYYALVYSHMTYALLAYASPAPWAAP